jgi:hypothetical protein
MSPTRTRRRTVPRHRTRREVLTAIGAAAAVVIGTAIMIWLLRPGPSGTEGTGGLANRQPRAAWLVALTLAALIGFTWWAVRRQRAWRGKLIIILLVGWLILGLGAVLAGILWPGGLLRHPAPAVEFNPEDFTTTVPVDTSSTLPGETTTAPAPGATTVPAGTETTVPTTTSGGP